MEIVMEIESYCMPGYYIVLYCVKWMKWKMSDHRRAEVTASYLINTAGNVRTHQHPAVQQTPDI